MKVAIGQFGAPTTVLNSSLYGVLSEFSQSEDEVYGVVGGISGLISGAFIRLPDAAGLRWLREVPGAALLAGRYADDDAAVAKSLASLQKHGFDALIVMGGNGTMGFAAALDAAAKAAGRPLRIIGLPKTIDNDIVGIDHAPGYPSAAQFVIQAVRDLQLDLEAMVGFEQVRVVEVMGRRCGWLAAATVLTGGERFAPAPIVLVPERPLNVPGLLQRIQTRVQEQGHALVVMSEGVRDEDGSHVLQVGDAPERSARAMFGGIGAHVTDLVRTELGYGTRYENLGLLQRCWSGSYLRTDAARAEQLGRMAVKVLQAGQSGLMVGLIRKNLDEVAFTETVLPLQAVAGQDRLLAGSELALGDAFQRWLRPLIDEAGLAEHKRIDEVYKRRNTTRR